MGLEGDSLLPTYSPKSRLLPALGSIPGWRKCPGEGNGGRSEDPAVLLVQNLGLNWSYSGSDQQTGIISITWWLVRNAES